MDNEELVPVGNGDYINAREYTNTLLNKIYILEKEKEELEKQLMICNDAYADLREQFREYVSQSF